MDWKTPYYYREKYLESTCDFKIRSQLGCTEVFFEKGFLKNSRWDEYAEYQTLCKNCEHYYKNVGMYFGNGSITDNISIKEAVWCRTRIKNSDELKSMIAVIPTNIKFLYFDDVSTDSLLELEHFTELESVLIGYCPKLEHFWDFSKTPKLKVLEYMANTHFTDLSELSLVQNLEYFGIETLTSRINLNYIDTFEPLTHIKTLKEVSLNSTMCSDDNINNLIDIPNLKKLWISPHTFSTEDFAKFEAQKFKIYNEYGIYQNNNDYIRPLGKGKKCFCSEKGKLEFQNQYEQLMGKFKNDK